MFLSRHGFGSGLAAGALLFAVTGANLAAHPSVDVVASNWKFTPATVEAHVGQETTLHFTSSEGVHGVESSDLGIPKTTIVPGKVEEVKFTPKKAGKYVIPCAIVCGEGHEKMALTITVVE